MLELNGAHQSGVSVVLCCFNAAKRIEATLSHLRAQKIPFGFPWEVILVDNASTDDTAQIAVDCWGDNQHGLPLRVIHEKQPGLLYARKKAIDVSRFKYVCFVDDDNWLSENYIVTAFSIMENKSSVGMLGGNILEQCEVVPESWFWRFLPGYAVGRQLPYGVEEGVCESVCGAGCVMRKEAWMQLQQSGIEIASVGRLGAGLSSGDDTELCFALRVIGWDVYCSGKLVLRHFISAERLKWDYYRKLVHGFGETSVAYIPYLTIQQYGVNGRRFYLRLFGMLLSDLGDLIRECLCISLSKKFSDEYYQHQANKFFRLGRTKAMLRNGLQINRRIRDIQNRVEEFHSAGRGGCAENFTGGNAYEGRLS